MYQHWKQIEQVTLPNAAEFNAINAILSNPSLNNPVKQVAAEGNLQECNKVFSQYSAMLNYQASMAAGEFIVLQCSTAECAFLLIIDPI